MAKYDETIPLPGIWCPVAPGPSPPPLLPLPIPHSFLFPWDRMEPPTHPPPYAPLSLALFWRIGRTTPPLAPIGWCVSQTYSNYSVSVGMDRPPPPPPPTSLPSPPNSSLFLVTVLTHHEKQMCFVDCCVAESKSQRLFNRWLCQFHIKRERCIQ